MITVWTSSESISSERDLTDDALWNSLDEMIATHGEHKCQYRETTQHRQEMVRRQTTSQFCKTTLCEKKKTSFVKKKTCKGVSSSLSTAS